MGTIPHPEKELRVQQGSGSPGKPTNEPLPGPSACCAFQFSLPNTEEGVVTHIAAEETEAWEG